MSQMRPISHVVYQMQYLTISFILYLQEITYEKVRNAYYMSAGFAADMYLVLGT